MSKLSRGYGIEFECGNSSVNEDDGYTDEYDDYNYDYGSITWAGLRKIENLIQKETYRNWSIGEDCDGIEVRTPPSNHYHWREISRVLALLKKQGSYEGSGWGTHVHLSRSGLSIGAQRRFLALWIGVEDAMFGLVDPLRRNCGWSDAIKHSYRPYEADRTTVLDEIIGCDFPRNKEVLHWSGFNTIECRLHHCTLNTQEIKDWTNLLQLMIFYATHNKDVDYYQRIQALKLEDQKTTLRTILRLVTPPALKRPLIRALNSRWYNPVAQWRRRH